MQWGLFCFWLHRQWLLKTVTLLPRIRAALSPEDILFFTADHGCDPTYTAHTDHTREYIPILVLGEPVRPGVDLGIRESFADIGQTVAEYLGIPPLKYGKSFLREILL